MKTKVPEETIVRDTAALHLAARVVAYAHNDTGAFDSLQWLTNASGQHESWMQAVAAELAVNELGVGIDSIVQARLLCSKASESAWTADRVRKCIERANAAETKEDQYSGRSLALRRIRILSTRQPESLDWATVKNCTREEAV